MKEIPSFSPHLAKVLYFNKTSGFLLHFLSFALIFTLTVSSCLQFSSQASLSPPVLSIEFLYWRYSKLDNWKRNFCFFPISVRVQKNRGHLRKSEINKHVRPLLWGYVSSVFNLQRLNSLTKWLSTIEAPWSLIFLCSLRENPHKNV